MSIVNGLGWPFVESDQGFPTVEKDLNAIKESIKQILSSGYGERVMRPSFGVDSWSFVFENNNDVLKALIRQQVRDAIQLHEPRVGIEAINVVAEDETVTTEIIFQWQGQAGSVDVEFPRNGNGF